MLKIPDLQEIRERMSADMDFRLPAFQKRPNKSVLGVLITVFSAAISTLYSFSAWMMKQFDPLTASPEWLAYWAARLNVPRKDATAARGKITFAGYGNVPVGTQLSNADDLLYITAESGDTDAEINLISESTGSLANLSVGTVLTLESPIAGVEMDAVISTALSGGAAIESLTAWAVRVAKRMAERQQIGDADDYYDWALQSHPDITDAWVYANTPQLGSISIRVILSGINPFASNEILTVAQLQMDEIRNQGATVFLLAPKQQPIGLRIAGIEDSDHQSRIKQAVDLLLSTKRQKLAELYPEEIERIISSYDNSYTLLSPFQKISSNEGYLLVTGEIEWL